MIGDYVEPIVRRPIKAIRFPGIPLRLRCFRSFAKQLGETKMTILGYPKTLAWSNFGWPKASVPTNYGGTHVELSHRN